jgi:hypothetical protein
MYAFFHITRHLALPLAAVVLTASEDAPLVEAHPGTQLQRRSRGGMEHLA